MHKPSRTGADAALETLLACGVNTCFANPGTSELGFVDALDRRPEMRAVLCLQEGVATGAADGYGRMRDSPAATLLHLGPGLANGLACLHNARRASTPVVNVVGDHATYHRRHDSPLTTDLPGVAAPFTDWFRSSEVADSVAGDIVAAVAAAGTPPGRVATLALPADSGWTQTDKTAPPPDLPKPGPPDEAAIEEARRLLTTGGKALMILAGRALRRAPLRDAARIAAHTGADMLAPTHNARVERGAGIPAIERIPYPVRDALAALVRYDRIILVGAREPAAFFAYPGLPGTLLPGGSRVHTLATASQDLPAALAALADALEAPAVPVGLQSPSAAPSGSALCPVTIAKILSQHMPEHSIVAEDAVSSGRGLFAPTAGAAPHDWLQTTGGAIGHGLPMATGAAIACADRPVICLQADGAGMYCLQALWTQAREGLNVTTVIFANRRYAILQNELRNLGFPGAGFSAQRLTNLDNPPIQWTALARGLGVPAQQVDTAKGFEDALRRSLASEGPSLIEALIV